MVSPTREADEAGSQTLRGERSPRDPAPVLQEDLKSEVDGAAALQEVDCPVEVDVMARGQDGRALAVVAGTPQRVVPPVLDAFDLGLVEKFELYRRH